MLLVWLPLRWEDGTVTTDNSRDILRSSELTRFRLAPNPGPMSLDGTNSYLIAAPGAAGTVVVDPGPLDEQHLQELAQAGAVELILITHRHADHTAAAARFAELTGAPVRAADPAHCHGGSPAAGRRSHPGGRSGNQGAGDAGPHLRFASASTCRRTARTGSVLTGDTILGTRDHRPGLPRRHPRRLPGLAGPAGTPRAGHRPARPRPGAAGTGHRRPRLPGPPAGPPRADPRRPGTLGRDAAGAGAVADAVYADVDPSVRRAAELSVAAQLRLPAPVRGSTAGRYAGAMRIARFVVDSDPLYGIVEGEPGSEEVTVIKGDPFFHGVERTAVTHKLEDVRLLAPIIPAQQGHRRRPQLRGARPRTRQRGPGSSRCCS